MFLRPIIHYTNKQTNVSAWRLIGGKSTDLETSSKLLLLLLLLLVFVLFCMDFGVLFFFDTLYTQNEPFLVTYSTYITYRLVYKQRQKYGTFSESVT